jgi:hypothetical protein
MMFATPDGVDVEIGGFGIDLSELVAVAQEQRVVESEMMYGLALASLLESGLRPVHVGQVDAGGLEPLDLVGDVLASVGYRGQDETHSVQIALGPVLPQSGSLPFLMEPLLDLTDAERVAIAELADRGVTVGHDPVNSAFTLASWPSTRGQVYVGAQGLSVAELVDVVNGVELATPEQWADLVERSENGELEPTVVDPGRFAAVLGEAGPSGTEPGWRIQMLLAPAVVLVASDDAGWGGPAGDISAVPTVRRFASIGITFYVGLVDASGPARQMRVSIEGEEPVELPMIEVGTSPIYGVGWASTSLAETTIEFLDDAGNVVG